MKQSTHRRLASAAVFVGTVGVVLGPVAASASTSTATTTISANIDTSISITSGPTVNMSVIPTSGGSQSSAADTVTVTTTNPTGYALYIKDTDGTDLSLRKDATYSIPDIGVTPAAAAVLTANTWGFAVPSGTTGADTNTFSAAYTPLLTNATTSTQKFATVPAANFRIKQTSTGAGSGDATPVYYSAMITTANANGTYSNSVTYTATTN